MIRVTVPRPVAEALMPRECVRSDCLNGHQVVPDQYGGPESVGPCPDCRGRGELPPVLRLLVVEGYWPPGSVTDEDHPPAPRHDVARAIEAGERIGIDVECETSVHLRPGRECIDNPACTDGLVRVGSVRPVRALPVRLDMYFRDDPGAVVVLSKAMTNAGAVRYAASPGAVSTDITDAMSVYGPAESLVGKFAVEVEDARREP